SPVPPNLPLNNGITIAALERCDQSSSTGEHPDGAADLDGEVRKPVGVVVSNSGREEPKGRCARYRSIRHGQEQAGGTGIDANLARVRDTVRIRPRNADGIVAHA